MRTYFGSDDVVTTVDPYTGEVVADPTVDPATHGDDAAATTVSPAEAALLAGMIASPSMYDPVQNPKDSQGPARPRAAAACSNRT